MKKIILVTFILVLAISLVACGETSEPSGQNEPNQPSEPNQPAEPSDVSESVVMVDVTSDLGISLTIPSTLEKQNEALFADLNKGDSVTLGVVETEGFPLSDWDEEDVVNVYGLNDDDLVVNSFDNGLEINGFEAIISEVSITTPKGHSIISVLVVLTDDVNNYVLTFTYGANDVDGDLVSNLVDSIGSIVIQ